MLSTRQRTKKARDTQRSRVYKCDEALYPLCRVDVSTVPAIEAYVTKVWASERVRAAFPKAFTGTIPTVGDGRRSRRARGGPLGIKMPKWARKESIVLHELAHTITMRVYGNPYEGIAGHGWQYCSVYLVLVRALMGRDAHDTLRAAFRRHRVRYAAPREKRALSPEKRVELVARLARARALKATRAFAWPVAAKAPIR